jgi:hypothetical protein
MRSIADALRESATSVHPYLILLSRITLKCRGCVGMRTSNMVERHKVSREANDGSRDNMQNNGYDEQRYDSRDQRADTWTTFYESDINSLDVSERRKKELRRALRRQEGEDYGEGSSADKTRRQRKQQNREEWKRRIIETYSTNLSMNTAQKNRAEHLFMDVLTINSFGHYSSEQVALAVLNVVAREDGWQLEENSGFHDLMVECDITSNRDAEKPAMDRMKKLRSMVRERVPSMNA